MPSIVPVPAYRANTHRHTLSRRTSILAAGLLARFGESRNMRRRMYCPMVCLKLFLDVCRRVSTCAAGTLARVPDRVFAVTPIILAGGAGTLAGAGTV